MFRAQNNQLDNAVAKATDENLTTEPWGLILDVCDQVSASPSGPQQVVAALIKRLAHRNANVQLYTLELANALSQNCGAELHRELASKAFTDALLRLAGDRNTHAQVKQKVLERMGAWTEQFGRNPELGIMEQGYGKLRQQQPGLMPPGKPVKKEISADERRKEEEELQKALALSVQDSKGAGGSQQQVNGGKEEDGGVGMGEGQGGAQQQQQTQQGTTAATVSRVRALYDFTPSEAGELAFRKGDVIAVLESVYKDWWKGSLRGSTGIFPLNYVEKLQDPTKEELEREAHMEGEVFGEIKNVEKLLSLLSVRSEGGGARRGEREEEEINELYQRTLNIRPKLIELIGKYSQKKDDFTSLNEKFIKARRDYEALLESSMSQPQYQQQYPVRQRPSNQQMYPPQQQPSYPPQAPPSAQGYSPQAPPSSAGYPPQQPYAAQSQPHLPPQPDVQRFYSPAPSEPPSNQQQQPGYGSPYPQQHAPVQPSNGPAPFHFIPGGLQQAAPPTQQQQPQPAEHQIRRKPSPQAPISAGPRPAPSDPYATPTPHPAGPGQQFAGQVRPNSIHTLNSGNPQELATGGYESPVDGRHSYPSSQHQQGMGMGGFGQVPGPYETYPPQQQQQSYPPQQAGYQQQRSDRDGLPSARQRTESFESPSSVYSGQQGQGWGEQTGGMPQQQQQAYQAYQPQPPQVQQVEGQRLPSGGSQGGDPGDFYR
ncbi:ESCRT-0 subunit protein hse1 [Saxophila tyrrhenica]|uniref:Class E vacuolar protein-sorting machinery protein HSE1 n=1 Tax=Saxophila tyrrhenica TaxID=1690608 RepID=A0AAV9NTL8_9PEZI|nr:ESCRT-0 subunit protein hse1 [Saxophila tyrrhenica]